VLNEQLLFAIMEPEPEITTLLGTVLDVKALMPPADKTLMFIQLDTFALAFSELEDFMIESCDLWHVKQTSDILLI
jgi:hypothetical protein